MPVTINGTSGITTPAGTVSGPLVISQNNSTGVAAISLPLDESTIQGPAANTAIRMGSNLVLRAAGQASIDTNNVARLIADSSGRVTMPTQPCFCARGIGSNMTVSGTVKYGSSDIPINVGSYYSFSTGRFTAPVNGNYLFCALGMGQNQFFTADIRKNGGAFAEFRTTDSLSNSNYPQASSMAIIPMSANDYVEVYFRSGILGGSPQEMVFSGQLIS